MAHEHSPPPELKVLVLPRPDRLSPEGDGVDAVHSQYREEVGREVEDVVVLSEGHEG